MIKKALFGIFILSLMFVPVTVSHCQEQEGGWRVIKSNYTTILLHPDVDIDYLTKRLKSGYNSDLIIVGFFFGGSNHSPTAFQGIFDDIYIKAQKILDMYPQSVFLKIKIFKNQQQLKEQLRSILGHESDSDMISYYAPDYDTIYTAEDAISPQIIAHEMGHAIAGQYFSTKIPKPIQELLAQYVETHLND